MSLKPRNLAAERTRRGMTQEGLAARLGVTTQQVSRWELYQAEPRAETLIKLSKIFKCSPEYLLGLTEDPHGTLTPKA